MTLLLLKIRSSDIVPTLVKKQPEQKIFYNHLGILYGLGCNINWDKIYPVGKLCKLPNYPWQKERYWLERYGFSNIKIKEESIKSYRKQPLQVENPTKKVITTIEDLEVYVVEKLAEQLKIAVSKINLEKPFKDVGLDSMMATVLTNLFNEDLDISISPIVFWSYPTVSTLLQLLAEKMDNVIEKSAPIGLPEANNDMVEDLSQLPEEDIAQLLLNELQSGRK